MYHYSEPWFRYEIVRLDLFFEKLALTSAQVDVLMLISEQCLFFKFMA